MSDDLWVPDIDGDLVNVSGHDIIILKSTEKESQVMADDTYGVVPHAHILFSDTSEQCRYYLNDLRILMHRKDHIVAPGKPPD